MTVEYNISISSSNDQSLNKLISACLIGKVIYFQMSLFNYRLPEMLAELQKTFPGTLFSDYLNANILLQ